MMAGGMMVDGTWELSTLVTSLEPQISRTLRVKGDLHVGGVMFQLVESLDIATDWSDHGLWWPEKNMWLSRTRSTLDQYGVQADARLEFTPMHKNLRIQLPDLQTLDMRVDYSINVFTAVIQICKEIGIRKPEELSFLRKLTKEDYKAKEKAMMLKKKKGDEDNGYDHNNLSPNIFNHAGSNNSLETPVSAGNSPFRTPSRSPVVPSPQGTLLRVHNTPNTPGSPFNYGTYSPGVYNGTMSPGSMHSLSFEGALESTLANSPNTPTREAMPWLNKPKNFNERARINAGWLVSSKSLMEQGVRENDLLMLRYKYYNFYDLNPKYDPIRINQIYEQAKWCLISEEIDCSEEEMMMFAALQLQIQIQTTTGQSELDGTNGHNGQDGGEDDIDAALADLQVSLEGSSVSSPGDITHIPELADYLRFFKPRKFTLKSYKKSWFVFKDTSIAMYKSKDDAKGSPMSKIQLRGCEVQPEVNIAAQKYCIKLFVPSSEGMSEMWIRCDTEDQYARWMAACKLAAKGKTMADSSYDSEVKNIVGLISMQTPAPVATLDPRDMDIMPEDYVSTKYIKKNKSKSIVTRILEAHVNVTHMTLLEAKMNYIKAWQALPDYGITYFLVKFRGHKKEELLGVASNRLMRMEQSSGDTLKTWRYSNMEEWKVNWEIKEVLVNFSEEKVAFHPIVVDCKILHEFIGGYIFLSMRSQEKNQNLNEEMFYKLTGGQV